ncbi:MAG TPA: hypothetical protein VMD92_05680 [Acidobacteriaceae bacterium]|jgi:hypothetical protein|nr:hypothetical protein [Acidobacteriaceae bacterium]
MFAPATISGPGYSVPLPPGFTLAGGMPAFGVYRLLPPGTTSYNVEALLQIRPVQPYDLQPLLQNVYSMDNPMLALAQVANLGLTSVLGVLPVRQVPMPQGLTHIREFDALNMFQMPLRVMEMVMTGTQSAVEILVVMSLYRWMDFVAPCLDFVARINLGGVPQAAPELRAVVDQSRKDQIEYQLVSPDHAPIPLTSLPTSFGGTTIIHVDTLIQTGNINGTGIAVGTHSTAAVTTEKSPASP